MFEEMQSTLPTPSEISASTLESWLDDGGEIALLDVREHGEFGQAHLFYSVPLPYSRLEADLERLVPRKGVRLVLCDDGTSGIAALAADRARQLGYLKPHVLSGGTRAWQESGRQLFAGVNTIGKTFGELVEHAYHTPQISAEALHERMAGGEKVIIVDGRPVDEYEKMNIPGSVCCPNGELIYRIHDLAPDPTTTIVVNCAGRTRSLLGSQTLHNFGVPNPVLALRDGTMGWKLADLELEYGSGRLYPELPDGRVLKILRAKAAAFADRWNVGRVPPEIVVGWLIDADRTTYLLDVRTPEEFAAGHCAHAVHAPGGQLLQASDQWLGVKGARLVLVDNDEVRATMVASWLAQMGWDVHVLSNGRDSWPVLDRMPIPARAAERMLPALPRISAHELAMRDRPFLFDLRASGLYRKSHIRGAVWAIRPNIADIARGLDPKGCIILVADNEMIARAFALDLCEHGLAVDSFVTDGPSEWQAVPMSVETSSPNPPDEERIDFLFFVHDRHDGNLDAAREYLSWEIGLFDQLGEREKASFAVRDRR